MICRCYYFIIISLIMGGVESCIICLNRQLTNNNGDYQYQIFKKVPFFGALKDYQRLFKGFQTIKGQPGSSIFQDIGGLIDRDFPSKQPSLPSIPFPSGSAFPSAPQPGVIDPSVFVNNLVNLKPIESVKGVGSIFDIVDINDGTFVKKIKKSNYADVLRSMEGTDKKFTDLQFPPNQQSLGNTPAVNKSTVKWMRINQILKDPVFVSDSIHPNDILQGSLGDCYFLSAIASLAQQQYRIKNIFPSLQINPHGIYMARVLYNGMYQQVVIDDFFPVNQRGEPCFAKPAGKREIWVMVLQKIWAKLFGSFGQIIGGLPQEVLHAFSSAPVFLKTMPTDPKKQQDLWNELVEAQQNGALLCCGTKNDPKIQELGFVKGHAYTVLGVYEKPFKLIKVRNPWGHKQWTGRASDYDLDFWNQISPADKQALDYEDSKRTKDKDGVFFLLWQDFVNYFNLVDICKINDNAHYNFHQSDFQHINAKLFEFQLRGNESNSTYAVTQPNKRGTENDSYSRSYLALGKWDQSINRYKYVKSRSDRRWPDNYLQVKGAPAGKYVLYVKYLWNGNNKNKAVVNIYSQSPAQVNQLTGGITSENFLNQIFYDHASKNSKKKTVNDKGDWVCTDILLNQGGFSYFVANVNKGSTTKLGVTLNQAQFMSLKMQLQPSMKGRQEIKQQVNQLKPFVAVAQLLTPTFPQRIKVPSVKVITLQ